MVHKCISTTASTITGGPAKGKPGEMPHGVKFEGTDGWLFVTRGKIEASKPEILNDKFGDKDVRLPVSNGPHGELLRRGASRGSSRSAPRRSGTGRRASATWPGSPSGSAAS